MAAPGAALSELILPRVPPGARVLDLGCGEGRLGRELGERRGCTVDGVELDPALAARAGRHYRRVLVADLTAEPDLGELDPAGYERVLLLDVIEHVLDGEALLRLAGSLLAPGGRLLISLPNAAHVSLRLELLAGDLDYEERGLLDRTHVRFYTRGSFLRLVAGVGLTLRDEDWTELPLSEELLEARLAHLDLRAGHGARQRLLAPEARAYQYVFELEHSGDGETTAPPAPPLKPLTEEVLLRRAALLERELLGRQVEALRAELDRLRGTRALQLAARWWNLKARLARLTRLARGPADGRGLLARLGRARRLVGARGPAVLWQVLGETWRGAEPLELGAQPLPPLAWAAPEGELDSDDGPAFGVVLSPGTDRLAAGLEDQRWPAWSVADVVATALERAARGDAEWLVFLAPGARLQPTALEWLAHTLRAEPGLGLLYGDDLCDGRPRLRPGWSPDLLDSSPYLGPVVAASSALVREVGGVDSELTPASLDDLTLRLAERLQPGQVRRIPRLLATSQALPASAGAQERLRENRRRALARRGEAGEVGLEPLPAGCGQPHGFRVRRALPTPAASVAVLIPTRDRLELLRGCLESARGLTDLAPRFVVIDNDSRAPETLSYLAQLEQTGVAEVRRDPRPFNFSGLINAAARELEDDVLVLLNNDTRALARGWLEALLEHALRPEVGAVGGKLLFPDGTVQHAGVVLGLGEGAGHGHLGFPADHPGSLGRLSLVGNYAAVTGACLALRRESLWAVGGLDEGLLGVDYGDVDLCLKLSAAGLRTVFTPYCLLEHVQSASRARSPDLAAAAELRRRWPAEVADDPWYHPLLSRTRPDFSW